MPCDPPRRLVTTGPYAYVSNPMQLSLVTVFLGWAALLDSTHLAATGIVVAAAGAVVGECYERRHLDGQHGPEWRAYRHAVRSWLPRWRPYADPEKQTSDSCCPTPPAGTAGHQRGCHDGTRVASWSRRHPRLLGGSPT